MAAYPQSVLLETVASAERATDAVVHALDIIFGGYKVGIFGGYRVGRPHLIGVKSAAKENRRCSMREAHNRHRPASR